MLTFLVIIQILLISFCQFSLVVLAQSGTEVGGIIQEDTTWTLENSPYTILETIQIPEGTTLTIEPGVVIQKPTAGDMFLLLGSILALGTPDSQIIFDGGGNSQFFEVYQGNGNFMYCEIKNGSNFWYTATATGNFELLHSKLTNIHGSTLGMILLEGPYSDIQIKFNSFINTNGIGVYQASGRYTKVYIENNLFSNLFSPIKHHGGTPGLTEVIVKYNSFFTNQELVLSLDELGNSIIQATENYWGAPENIDIEIYDRNDDVRLDNYIDYLPTLDEPHPDTPVPKVLANFSSSELPIITEKSTSFDASGSSSEASSIISYLWNFGDETIETTNYATISHVYQASGEFIANLTVIDEYGLQNSTLKTVTVLSDDIPPEIDNVIITPESEIQEDQEVEVSVEVYDDLSGIDTVSLLYSIDDGVSWDKVQMAVDSTPDVWSANIPGQQIWTNVIYKISADDNAGNTVTTDGAGVYSYEVIPEFSSWIILPLFLIATLAVIELRKKLNCQKKFKINSN